LVCLDASPMDDGLLKYTRFIVNTAEAVEHIYFVNVLRRMQLPSEVKAEFPELEDNMLQERKQELDKGIQKYFSDNKDVQTELIVQSGGRVRTFKKLIKKYNIDLVMIGRKIDNTGSGIITQRMGRRCPCNLMIVPQGSEVKIMDSSEKHVMQVLVDFSEHSKHALETAIQMATNFSNTQVVCQHVYSVPTGYHYAGKSHDEFGEIMVKNAKKQFKQFIKGLDTRGIELIEEYTLDDNEDRVYDMIVLANKLKPTGIIFGSKGVSAASSFFIGSTAEKLIKIDTEFPLYVIRKPGESKGIVEVLQRM